MGFLNFAPAKINLGLYVTGKRQDGFHDLETIFYPVSFLYDVLEFSPAKEPSFHLHGADFVDNGAPNLVQKAVQLFQESTGKDHNWRVDLLKRIPSGAGLGGGSSDAASTLLFLNAYHNDPLTSDELAHLGLVLGSDVPFFLGKGPAMAWGRGEKLEYVDGFLSGWYLLMVFPEVQVSTSEAYLWVQPDAAPEQWQQHFIGFFKRSRTKDLRQIPNSSEPRLPAIRNSFQDPVQKRYKAVSRVLEGLNAMHPVYSGLSGSGSTCFGLFREKVAWKGREPWKVGLL